MWVCGEILAKLLGTDLHPLFSSCFTIWRLHPLLSYRGRVNTETTVTNVVRVWVLLKTLRAVPVGAHLRTLSLLYKPGACCSWYQVTENSFKRLANGIWWLPHCPSRFVLLYYYFCAIGMISLCSRLSKLWRNWHTGCPYANSKYVMGLAVWSLLVKCLRIFSSIVVFHWCGHSGCMFFRTPLQPCTMLKCVLFPFSFF